MNLRTLLIVGLAFLPAPGALWSREQPAAVTTDMTPPVVSGLSAEPVPEGLQTRIFALRYRSAMELADLIRAVTGEDGARTIIPDARNNTIIVTTTPERMDEIGQLLVRLDTSRVEASQTQSLMYRVYMLEIPAKDRGLKAFSLVLERPSPLPAADLLDASKDADLQIGTFLQSNEWGGNDKWQLVFQGRAASSDALKRLTAKTPESQVKELRWEDDAFASDIAAAQFARMPVSLQEYLRKFLGDEVQTVGYWFGSLSVPGDVRAPLGPWTLELKVEPGQETELALEIKLSQDAPVPFLPAATILSNAVRGKVGKPVIIGYSRPAYGTRKIGALVVLPETDTAAPAPREAKTL